MKRQMSVHNKSASFLNKSPSFTNKSPLFINQSSLNNKQSSTNFNALNQNFIQQPQSISKHHSSSQPKIAIGRRQSNQNQKQQNDYFITTPNNLIANNNKPSTLLKRTSMLRNKNENDIFNDDKELKYHKLKSKQNVQISESNNMFLTNIDQRQGFMQTSQQSSMKKLHWQTGGYQSVYTSGSTTPKGKLTVESKWQKIMQLYTMREQLADKFQFPSAIKLRKKYPILPSGQFYRILWKNRVFDRQWRINFPQTIFEDNEGNTVMIFTDMQGIFRRKVLQKQNEKKQRYREQVMRWREQLKQQLINEGKTILFKQIKLDENPNIPLSIMKYTQDNAYQFETDVQSYRNFIQKKLRPTRDSIMQRYIYSNNLKAMVFRLYYTRQSNKNPGGANKPQYTGIRFQNEKAIFKESTSNSFCDTHKLTSTIMLSNQRINSIKLIPINNPKTLLKYTPIAKQLQKLLQYTQKLLIDKLYIDFIVDVFDKPWVINIKYCEVNPNSMTKTPILEDHTNNVGPCRLCGVVVPKQQLKNSVSVRMLCEFLHHLKKRTKHQDMHTIEFIQNLTINSMENKSSSVCKICYKVIIHQLQLIKMEKKLAQICNIIPSNNDNYLEPDHKALRNLINIGQYKQWRLMLYFQDIKNVQVNLQQSPTSFFNSGSLYHGNDYFSRNESTKTQTQYFLKYELCPKISQSFLCRKQNGLGTNLKIKKVKLHYFYSQNTNIEQFINNTEIIISLYSAESKIQGNNNNNYELTNQQQYDGLDKLTDNRYEKVYHNEKLLASGSTQILSNFNLHQPSSCSLKTLMQNGQKQTATVLLFFQNRKYCELTLKVGLVYDGSYNVSNIPTKRENNTNEISQFIKWNEVWFSRNLWNSNPLPKQWMEIFGSKYNYDNNSNSIQKDDIITELNQEEILRKILDQSDHQNSDQQY